MQSWKTRFLFLILLHIWTLNFFLFLVIMTYYRTRRYIHNPEMFILFCQYKLTLVSVQLTLRLFLFLRIRGRLSVSWTKIKVRDTVWKAIEQEVIDFNLKLWIFRQNMFFHAETERFCWKIETFVGFRSENNWCCKFKMMKIVQQKIFLF